ncbi:MAG TPA: type II secretion system protein [Symbiobacteriaceae bacterium]|nr:type II secretion system protein [Symbiobacteriaceae bacterium]
MLRRLGDQRGFTLVELLLTTFILVIVLAMITGIVVAAQVSTKASQEQGDTNEQIRGALNQMAEDFSFGQWCSTCVLNDQTVAITAYQQNATKSASGYNWNSGWGDWPGSLTDARTLRIQYQFVGGQLVRTVVDAANTAKIYSEQVLVSGLVPYDGTSNGSLFDVTETSQRLIGVVLKTTPKGVGVSAVAETRGMWFVR